MRLKGSIRDWRDDQGFGFIEPEDGGARVFAHIKAFANPQLRPQNGTRVTYLAGTDGRGRPCAVKIALEGERYAAPTRQRSAKPAARGNGPVLFAILFVALLIVAIAADWLPIEVGGWYAVLSLLTFAIYASDKSAAQSGAWRTQESTLHLLSLTGGSPGALTAQRRLRHKSSKQSFQTMFWVTVTLNCGVLAWLLTSDGRTLLQDLLDVLWQQVG